MCKKINAKHTNLNSAKTERSGENLGRNTFGSSNYWCGVSLFIVVETLPKHKTYKTKSTFNELQIKVS